MAPPQQPPSSSSSTPRSVSDATRFTATTPHASSKGAVPGASRFAPPRTSPAAAPSAASASAAAAAAAAPPPFNETPEQKVARLRAAHLRARQAQVSKVDRIIDMGRRMFDTAHRVTVYSLVGFTVIAGIATAYTAYDMITYNKKRQREWVEAQMKIEAEELAAARLAYIKGTATEDQIKLVEEEMEKERKRGERFSFFNLPKVLDTAEKDASKSTQTAAAAASSAATQKVGTGGVKPTVTETVSWPLSKTQTQSQPTNSASPEQESKGLWAWLTSNLKKEEEGDDSPAQRRLGWESLSEEDSNMGVRDSDIARAVEEKRAFAQAKALEAAQAKKAADEAAAAAAAAAEGGKKEGKRGWFW